MNHTEEKYAYMSQLPQAVCITAPPKNRIRFVNQLFADLFDSSIDHLLHKPLSELLSIDENAASKADTMNEQGKHSSFATTKTGRYRRLELQSNPLIANDGQAKETIWLITAASGQLKASTSYSIFNGIGNPIFIVDAQATIMDANDEAARFLNCDKAQLYNSNMCDMIANAPALMQNLQQSFKTEHAISFESSIRLGDSDSIPVELNINQSFYFGNTAGIIVAHDLRKRKAIERALQQTQTLQDVLLNHAFDAIYVTRGKHFEYVNKSFCQLTGYSFEEATSDDFNFSVLIADKSKSLIEERFKSRQRGEIIPARYEFTVKTKSGREIEAEITTTKLSDENEVRVLGIIRDVSERVKMRRELEQEKAFFESLFYAVPFGTVLLDTHDKVIDANEAFTQMFQYSKEEAIGKTINSLIVPDEMEKNGLYLTNAVARGQAVQTETLRKRKDGSLLDVAIIGKPFSTASGEQLVYGIYQDISERVAFRKAIEKEKAYFQFLFESIPFGLVLLADDNIIMDCNEGFCKLFGYDKQEIIGRENINIIFTESYQEEGKMLRQKVSAGESVYAETKRKHKDGSLLDVAVLGHQLRMEDGSIFVFGLYQDIGERVQAEARLKEERDLMQALMDNIPDTIYFKDLKGRFIRINYAQARALGVSSPEDATGKTDFDFFDQEHAEKARKDEQRLFETGDDMINEQEHILTANGWRWFSVSKVPLYDSEGNLTGLAGVSRDLTAFKHMEQALRNSEKDLIRSNKEKDKLFSVIAHDLRSPFNSFLMLTEIFSDESYDLSREEIKKLMTNVHKQANSLYDLLENLLSWSAVQRGRIVVDKKEFSLKRLINNTIDYFKSMIEQKNMNLTNHIADEQTVYADWSMLSSVLRNLLSNALKFTPRGGSIEIACEQLAHNKTVISVSDTGIGIPQKLLEGLFDIETKGRKGTEGEPSSGLGLILVKDFVELNEGNIQVESEEGKGTTFRLALPSKQ